MKKFFVRHKKFVYFNIILLLAYMIPVLLAGQTHYKCDTGMIGIHNTPVFSAIAETFKEASKQSIAKCQSTSHRPDKCDLLYCENKYLWNDFK